MDCFSKADRIIVIDPNDGLGSYSKGLLISWTMKLFLDPLKYVIVVELVPKYRSGLH